MSDAPDKDKGGRPSKFSDKLAAKILAMAAAGDSDGKIAAKLGIARSTLSLWKSKHGEFSEALGEAKDIADELVEAALFQRAVGYRHPAVKFFCHEGFVTSQKYIEIYPPDANAAQFWLKNRQPDRWRELKALEHSGPGGKPIQVVTAKDIEAATLSLLEGSGASAEPGEAFDE